jgi:hypothetical protein
MSPRRSLSVAALAVLTSVAPMAAVTSTAAATVVQAPMHLVSGTGSTTPFFISHGGGLRHTNASSTNWSGYAANGSTYTSVSTTFTQPKVTCSRGDQYSSFWVGLDGYSSSSVEQTGTEADCAGTSAQYSAWYEMYPADPVTYSNTVKPGDVITETVSVSSNTYTMTIKDTTEGWTKTTTKTESGLDRSSAEVIAEAPYSGKVLPLADFGTVTFSNSTVDGSTLSASSPTGINMATSAGKLEATTSALSGGAFSITWNSK